MDIDATIRYNTPPLVAHIDDQTLELSRIGDPSQAEEMTIDSDELRDLVGLVKLLGWEL